MVTEPVALKNVEIVHRSQRDVIDILGIWCEWKTTEDETNHHYCVLEMTLPPGAGVPLHRHSIQETFTVMEGSAEF
jgi:quercetin dioxygenase-like cupin family protein